MTLYDDDFVSWTKQQANLLRSMPAVDGLDIDQLVDEVEALGRTAVAELSAALRRTLAGLIDLTVEPGSVDHEIIYAAQSDAMMLADNGVARHADLEKTWRLAVRAIKGFPDRCPYSMPYLLSEDFDVTRALASIRS